MPQAPGRSCTTCGRRAGSSLVATKPRLAVRRAADGRLRGDRSEAVGTAALTDFVPDIRQFRAPQPAPQGPRSRAIVPTTGHARESMVVPRVLVVALVAVVVPHGSPRAQLMTQTFMTGKDLLAYCTDASKSGICAAYIAGVSDAISAGQGAGALPRRGKGCPSLPVGARTEQAVDVVVRWLQAHPEVRHLGAAGLVWGALSEAWPCPAQ
jgi:hypothetical protein